MPPSPILAVTEYEPRVVPGWSGMARGPGPLEYFFVPVEDEVDLRAWGILACLGTGPNHQELLPVGGEPSHLSTVR